MGTVDGGSDGNTGEILGLVKLHGCRDREGLRRGPEVGRRGQPVVFLLSLY